MRPIIVQCGERRGGVANGCRGHRLYETWRGMIARCENQNRHDFHHYGGRGIAVCDDWHDMFKFVEWAEASGWSEGLTLDRINTNGPYAPTNCRWVTKLEQNQNRRNNVHVVVGGRKLTIAAAAREHGISDQTVRQRLKRGWSVEEALKPPH